MKKAGLTDNQISKIVEDLKSFLQKYPGLSVGAINLTMHIYTGPLGTFREKRMLANEALRDLLIDEGVDENDFGEGLGDGLVD